MTDEDSQVTRAPVGMQAVLSVFRPQLAFGQVTDIFSFFFDRIRYLMKKNDQRDGYMQKLLSLRAISRSEKVHACSESDAQHRQHADAIPKKSARECLWSIRVSEV